MYAVDRLSTMQDVLFWLIRWRLGQGRELVLGERGRAVVDAETYGLRRSRCVDLNVGGRSLIRLRLAIGHDDVYQGWWI
jgi:hypothetical protein